MKLKIGNHVLTPSLNSSRFDLNVEKQIKTGKGEGGSYLENIGYDMSITHILPVLSKAKVISDKDVSTLSDLVLKLTETTERVGKEIEDQIKKQKL